MGLRKSVEGKLFMVRISHQLKCHNTPYISLESSPYSLHWHWQWYYHWMDSTWYPERLLCVQQLYTHSARSLIIKKTIKKHKLLIRHKIAICLNSFQLHPIHIFFFYKSIYAYLVGWSTWKTVKVPPPLVSTTKAKNFGLTAQKFESWALLVSRIFSKHWP